ncbi:hypothetical protein CL616_03180 [archaeon]|nr:hypothetical protein [archaeon]
MRLVKTNDGSVTFYSEKYKECFHSSSGAMEEALKKFVLASKLKEGERVLDVCFGLGYNTFMALKNVDNISVVALEKDKEVLEEIEKLGIDLINKIVRGECENVKLIIGDALETIDFVDEVDVIFHDPFSLKKNPELWTESFFKKEFDKLSNGGRLVTYSCAREVRENLKKAGFKVYDVEAVGRRGPSTLAVKV